MAVGGIPFVGENNFYPNWAKRSSWIFQRTLVCISSDPNRFIAESHVERVPTASEVIVWVPGPRGLFNFGAVDRERDLAVGRLARFRMRCYGNECDLSPYSNAAVKALVRERSVWPQDWNLACPRCGAVAGPDIAGVRPEPIIERWKNIGRPVLENPGASPLFRSAPKVRDLPEWMGRTEPSHLELCYVAQQMWPDIFDMLNQVVCAVS